MSTSLPDDVDTVIVGNGPSALILSYILHGHLPFYDVANPHPDPLLHQKLKSNPCLLNTDVDYLTDHFSGSRFSYSTQALPVNVLFDTLIRPYSETDDASLYSCIKWEFHPERAVDHVVVGNTDSAGGQWVDNPVEASWDIETLSYAGMLSLPGYTFSQHYERTMGQPLPSFLRPSRREVASYLAEYPIHAGIDDAIRCGQTLHGISRNHQGFYIASHNISCKHLVLATGVLSQLIPPRPMLQPLVALPKTAIKPSAPLLVIGSGFSAADVIISSPPNQKIIHIYQWAPKTSPSPLKACHQDAYPEYAGVYRRMKLAAISHDRTRPKVPRTHSSAFELSRNWDDIYEGLPNTAVRDVSIKDGVVAEITFQSGDEPPFQRVVSGLAYVVGRRGSLSYLVPELQTEVGGSHFNVDHLTGQTLREKALSSTEVANDVFIIGSLTGDSLVRFAYGGCVYAAGKIFSRHVDQSIGYVSSSRTTSSTTTTSRRSSPGRNYAMNGLDGHQSRPKTVDS